MLTERQEKLLAVIIGEYIKTAEPISSKLIEEAGIFDVSSATIRNDMNELEQDGYLEQPHISSGRVPTDKAYRFFVDKVIAPKVREAHDPVRSKIRQIARTAGEDPREVNKAIAQLISGMSDQLIIASIKEQDEFYKTGLSNLLGFPEFREFERMFNLTNFFDHFDRMFAEVELQFSGLQEIQIFIGRENPVKDIRDETLITASYSLPMNALGSLTMIGPMRMDYRKNIALMKNVSEELNSLYQ